MIRVFVYSKNSGALLYEDTGLIDYVMHDINDDKDFTLTPPPNYDQPWYWVDNKWTTDQPS